MNPMKNLCFIPALVFLFLLTASCREAGKADAYGTICYSPTYATGFEITGIKDSCSRVIRVKSSWQGDRSVSELFIARNGERPPEGFAGQILYGDASRIAAMSSSHVALLGMTGKVSTVKAVSGIRFISDKYIRENRENIADIGSDADADFEKLLAADPDIVLLYGINSSSAMEGKLRDLGIPFVYIGEYLEGSALGRAEWMVVLAEITGCRQDGEKTFCGLVSRYNRLKALVPQDAERPVTMLNIPYGDTWFMASGQSVMAGLISDAGGEYIYRKENSGKSVPIDMEMAFILVSRAEFWLNAGRPEVFRHFLDTHQEFRKTECVSEGNVYSCDKRMTDGGGSDFWETGVARPDLILEDLIRIFHPEALSDDAAGNISSSSGMHFYYRIDL